MNVQTLAAYLPYIPFLSLLYVLFALLQALRKKQQGFFAAFIAFIAVAVPLAALILMPRLASRLTNNLLLSAIVMFVASLVILMIERGNRKRAAGRSYGMIGVTLGVLIAAETLVIPLVSTTSANAADFANVADAASASDAAANTSANANAANANTTNSDGSATDPTLRNVSAVSTSTAVSAIVEVLTTQTGLTADELATQLEAGSTIAQLVEANGGDLETVITAVATQLDTMKSSGGMGGQMLANLGSDSTTIATQFVQGETESRAQSFLVRMLTGTGFSGGPGNGAPGANGTPGALGGGFAPPADGTGMPSMDGQFVPPSDGANGQMALPAGDTAAGAVAASEATATPQLPAATSTPTEAIVRPTLIMFPTATPTPDATAIPETGSASAGVNAAVTCNVVINYNLNLREEPNTDSNVKLSIPFGASVEASGRSADGWYRVTYEGLSGWVSGDYVTAAAECAALEVVSQ